MKRILACLMVVSLVAPGLILAADQTAMEKERAEHRKQVAEAINSMGRLMTAFDYLTFNLSGPVVVMDGFTTKPVIKKDAETAIRKIEWVTHVVNKIEELPIEPAVNDLRKPFAGLRGFNGFSRPNSPASAADIKADLTHDLVAV